MTAKVYRNIQPKVIRPMVEEDRYAINYNMLGAFNPDEMPLTYVWRYIDSDSSIWNYMTAEEFENWKEVEI